MANTITSADAVFMLSVLPLYPSPQQLQGFMADDIFDVEDVDIAELVLGADGVLSAGYIPYLNKQNIAIMPDSPSSIIFETWIENEKITRSKFSCTGTILLKSTSRKYTLSNGYLSRIVPIPEAKKVLQGRKFQITWGDISPAAA